MALASNRAAALYAHVRALEKLQEAKDEAAGDYNERKKLAKEDGFDTNVLAAILKRRKAGEGQTVAFDELMSEYEDMIEAAKDQPLADRDDEDDSEPGAAIEGFDERTIVKLTDHEAYEQGKALVLIHHKASTSWLQRQLRIGYNSAARVIEQLEKEGLVSSPDQTGKREVLTPGPGDQVQ